MALVCKSTHFNPSIVTDGLVLCLDAANPRSYPGSGVTWFDISGRGNHFTLVNAPVFNTNRIVFDGVNDSANSTNTINFNTNTITIQFIFKASSYPTFNGSNAKLLFEHSNNFNLTNNTFIHYYVSDVGSSDIFAGTKGIGGSFVNYNYSYFNKSNYNDLNWKFCNIIFDGTSNNRETYFYVQSTEQSPIASPQLANNNQNYANTTLYIGGRGGTSIFADMELSYFSIYSRILNQSEITQNYNALRGRFNI